MQCGHEKKRRLKTATLNLKNDYKFKERATQPSPGYPSKPCLNSAFRFMSQTLQLQRGEVPALPCSIWRMSSTDTALCGLTLNFGLALSAWP